MSFRIMKFWIIILFLPMLATAQGIRFEKGRSWATIRDEAKSQGKYIFLDCFATWCGPCKEMDRNIFPIKEVGDFFNANFINVSVQMDRTANDPGDVREWYEDAVELQKKFQITAFPTYLFFSPEGKLVHRIAGAEMDYNRFISKARDAMDPARQYTGILANWEGHKNDSAFLLFGMKAALDADDQQFYSTLEKYYKAVISDKPALSRENIGIVARLVRSSSDKEFQTFYHNPEIVDSIVGSKDFAESIVSEIIFKEQVEPVLTKDNAEVNWTDVIEAVKQKYPELNGRSISNLEQQFAFSIEHEINVRIFAKDAPLANWNEIAVQLKIKYADYDCSAILSSIKSRYFPVRVNLQIDEAIKRGNANTPDWKNIAAELKTRNPSYNFEALLLRKEAMFFASQKLWNEYERAIFDLFNKYSGQFSEYLITENEATDIVWNYIFMHSRNEKLLAQGLGYIKRLTEQKPIGQVVENDMDTYANLLYKSGKVRDAIYWENKAIEMVSQRKGRSGVSDLATFQSNLTKMTKGEKTWDD